MLDPFLMTRVGEDQADARVQEGELTVAMLELFEVEIDDLESRRARQEGHARALLALGRGAGDLERRDRVAESEAHLMLLAVAPDRQVEPFAERVDDRDADAVKAARDFIGIVVAGIFEF